MAAACTISQTGIAGHAADVRRLVFDWQSASDGSVSQATGFAINGVIARVIFIPDGGGTQPSNAYDVTITDTAGMDVLSGQGANLANNATTNICPGVPLKDGTTTSVIPQIINDVLTLNVTNAGDTKGGQVVLYLR